MCLPNSFCKHGSTYIPRSKQVRDMLGRNGLLGKIRLTSSMTEAEIMDEICSVFEKPMRNNPNFAFKILQPTGGSSKSLSTPALSSTFRWTASAIAGKSNKAVIYILAENELQVYLLMYSTTQTQRRYA